MTEMYLLASIDWEDVLEIIIYVIQCIIAGIGIFFAGSIVVMFISSICILLFHDLVEAIVDGIKQSCRNRTSTSQSPRAKPRRARTPQRRGPLLKPPPKTNSPATPQDHLETIERFAQNAAKTQRSGMPRLRRTPQGDIEGCEE